MIHRGGRTSGEQFRERSAGFGHRSGRSNVIRRDRRRAVRGAIALALLLAGSARAQGGDLLGVFFDAQGTVSTYRTTAANEIVPIYLVLLAPSRPEAVTSWECIVEARSAASCSVFNWQLAGGGVNYDQSPRFYVALGTPLLPADRLVLASASVLVADPGAEVAFYLHAYDPPSLRDPPGNGYPVETPNCGYGDGGLQALGWISGCESEPVALVNDDGESVHGALTGLPERLGFGAGVPVTPVTRTFLLTNPSPVTVSAVLDVSGPGFFFTHSSRFWTQEPCWVQIGPGEELSVSVILGLLSTEGADGELTVAMCGQVTSVPLLRSDWDGCAITPAAPAFGEVMIGATREMTITVQNSGTYTLRLDPSFYCPEFEFGRVTIYVPVGLSVSLPIRFTPTMPGPRSCTISLGAQACASIVCAGIGLEPPPQCEVSAADILFPALPVGASQDTSLVIRNSGGGLLEGVVALAGETAPFTIVSGGGAFQLGWGQSRSVALRFAPDRVGDVSCQLTFGGQCDPVTLGGAGFTADLPCSIAPAAIDFDTTCPGCTVERSLLIRNDSDWQVSGLAFASGVGFSTSPSGPFVVAAHGQFTLPVRFTPPAAGDYLGAVTTGLALCPSVPISGRCTWAGYPCALAPAAVDFGTAHPGWPALRNLAIRNDGSVTLSGILAVTGDGFTLGSPGPFTLGPQQSLTCQIAFDPPGLGQYAGLVTTGLESCAEAPVAGTGAEVTEPHEIVAWGEGPGNPPTPNIDFVAVAAGGAHSLGLKADGSVVAWGNNDWGQCDVPQPNAGFVAVAASGTWEWSWDGVSYSSHSLGLKSDGSIAAWGNNDRGQCDVPEPNTGFVAVAAGLWHSLGVKSDGSIVAWGDNETGQCDVPEPNTGFTAVAAGACHSLGRKGDGSIVAWGDNSGGGCDVPSPNTGFVAIAASGWVGYGRGGPYYYGRSLGLKSDGSVVAWPDSTDGWSNVPEPNGGFVAIAAGLDHSLGLRGDGSVAAWGGNDMGQCAVPEPNTGFLAIAAGCWHSVGIRHVSPVLVEDPPPGPNPGGDLPTAFAIAAVAPNPFNPRTTVWFDLPRLSEVSVAVYDLRGRLVRSLWRGARAAGRHSVEWDGRDERGTGAAAGVYVVQLQTADGIVRAQKATLAK